MTRANASQADLGYVREASYGAGMPAVALDKFRATDWDFNTQKTGLISEEQRSDAQIPFFRHGVAQSAGDINCELSWKALKDFIRAGVRYSAVKAANPGDFTSTAGADTLFVNATSKITRTGGSWVTDKCLVNMKIRTTGAGQSANNAVFTVTAVSALEITVSEALTQEAAGQDVKIQSIYFENGVFENSFAIEQRMNDITQFDLYTGVKVSTMRVSAAPDSFVPITFGIMGQLGDITGTSGDTAGGLDDVDTTEPVDTHQTTMTVKEGGSASTIITAFELNVDLQRTVDLPLGFAGPTEIDAGRTAVTGSITVYMEDAVEIDKFLDETESSLEISFNDPDGNQIFFTLPAIKYSGADHPVSGSDRLFITMPFQAFMDSSTGLTIYGSMVPAIAL